MSLYDRIPPSERLAELSLVVKRLRRKSGLDVVPVLIVEGPNDETLLGVHCNHGARQVFAAGTRGLVEQMLLLMRGTPIAGCEGVFLTDCDGYGKPAALRGETSLVVTAGCDVEADLVSLGVATRVATDVLGQDASALVHDAIAMSLPLSLVRRRAASASVSMKRRQQRLRLSQLPRQVLVKWSVQAPSVEDAITTVAEALTWSGPDILAVQGAAPQEPQTFARCGSGKDAIEALFYLLEARHQYRGMTLDAFERRIRKGLNAEDFANWEVTRRIAIWQTQQELELIPGLPTRDNN